MRRETDLARLPRARAHLGITQSQLARRMGYSWTTVQRWEQGIGTISNAQIDKLKAMLSA